MWTHQKKTGNITAYFRCSMSSIERPELHVNVRITVKNICGTLHVMEETWKNVKETNTFSKFLSVRIEIDLCWHVICCLIYHWLSISSKWIDHEPFTFMIYPLLELTVFPVIDQTVKIWIRICKE